MEEIKKVVDDASESSNEVKDEDKKVDKVDYKTYDRVMNRLKKVESILAEKENVIFEKENQLKEILNQSEEKQKQELEKKGEYQKLLELEKQRREELSQQFESTKKEKDEILSTLMRAKKEQIVSSKIPGRLLKSSYYDFLDLDNVVVDPETGEIDEESAAMVANKFVKEFPELIDKKSLARLPSEASTIYTPENFRDVPLKEMRKRAAESARELKRKMGL